MDSDVPITPAPVTGALSATSTPPTAGNATAPGSVVTPATKDMQASSVKSNVTKKARAKPKPKPSDWMTSIFGQ